MTPISNPLRWLWLLPFAAAALPLLATLLAYVLSIRLELAPACNPLFDGCVSISRAARHGLPNILFRALLLPAAVLQILCWLLFPLWLRSLDATAPTRWMAALPWLGTFAGICLILYGSFLGTDGEGYRLMRRYGVAFYFGFTCIGMLVVSGEVQRLVRAERHHRWVGNALLGLCLALPLLGLLHVFVPLALPGEATRNALQNITEWWGGVIFTLFFFVLAWAWWRSGAELLLRLQRPTGR
ncbi:hypothetical protein [Piscinibacter sakaiensis]|uniref:hypothetical protein n=1 Tax=Piscinibacter sakaiensis TaxID=1547922 RepID=UPI003AAEB787